MTHVAFITPDWPAPQRVRAAFTLRNGGVSEPPFDTLNLGTHVEDDPRAVAENRRRVRATLSLPAEPFWLEQVHGTQVASLDDAEVVNGHSSTDAIAAPVAPLARADAAVTHHTGRVCVIQVADCMPVLFAAIDGTAVAAAHAGWRGLAGGVLERTVQASGVPARELIAWMGPAIGREHFEVGDEVRAAFLSSDAEAAGAFTSNARGRWQCDLYTLARRRLERIGIRSVHGGGWCTYADAARFFSYRRDKRCGRMAALIWMAP